ncbi:MAG: ribonuclease H-like domain-containing protein [Bryobacteraceae bacterium]|nr:ribonuclease H-like domain-containing protein [Bryobacteraceae bacterium]MDW8378267.1 ribonuclease H-like domain-containing protein [Bryobacterales bacterium]
MQDIQAQLAYLRRRIQKLEGRSGPSRSSPDAGNIPVARSPFVVDGSPPGGRLEQLAAPEEWMPGEEVFNSHGVHFQTTRFWPRHRRHGAMDLSELVELPADLLQAISEGAAPATPPERWVYLDTETTGLSGGSGTYAFLIGLGYATPDGFRLKQYFLRNPGEEASALQALSEDLASFDVMVTYNGKAYDQPLLETRYRMVRQRPPFARLAHVDLLYGARRLWKLRLDSCRLMELEHQILGVEREGDIPSELIPYLYFDYLRKQEIVRLVPVFHHNATDILTLACLTAIVPYAFQNPSQSRFRHGAEMLGIARWMRKENRLEEALSWLRAALSRRLSEQLQVRTLWEIAELERKMGRDHAALEVYTELASFPNTYRVEALEELAKHYEHKERNLALALSFVEQALHLSPSASLQHRAARLERKLAAKPKQRRLL